jgi:hypothetical protein
LVGKIDRLQLSLFFLGLGKSMYRTSNEWHFASFLTHQKTDDTEVLLASRTLRGPQDTTSHCRHWFGLQRKPALPPDLREAPVNAGIALISRLGWKRSSDIFCQESCLIFLSVASNVFVVVGLGGWKDEIVDLLPHPDMPRTGSSW